MSVVTGQKVCPLCLKPGGAWSFSLLGRFVVDAHWDCMNVLKWHDVEGCHLHSHDSVAEGVCCICDAEDVCSSAVEQAQEWRAERERCSA